MIIYKLTSPSNKVYIGLTKDTLDNRWKQHVTLWRQLKRKGISNFRGHKGCPVLYFGFDKYPPETWTREVIYITEDADDLRQKEINFIKEYNAIDNGYNILTGGQFGHHGRELEEEHKQNQSKAMIEYWSSDEATDRKKSLSDRMKGNTLGKGLIPHNKGITGIFKHTEISRQKMADKQIGKKFSQEHKLNINKAKMGVKQTKETIDRAAESRRGFKQSDSQKQAARDANSQTWLVTHPNGTQETIVNLRQFCKDHGLSQGNLCAYGKTKGYKAEKV